MLGYKAISVAHMAALSPQEDGTGPLFTLEHHLTFFLAEFSQESPPREKDLGKYKQPKA